MDTYKVEGDLFAGMDNQNSLTPQQVDQLGYFINDWLRLMSHGEEYRKLVSLVNDLYRSGIDFPENYYHIHFVIDRGTRRS